MTIKTAAVVGGRKDSMEEGGCVGRGTGELSGAAADSLADYAACCRCEWAVLKTSIVCCEAW